MGYLFKTTSVWRDKTLNRKPQPVYFHVQLEATLIGQGYTINTRFASLVIHNTVTAILYTYCGCLKVVLWIFMMTLCLAVGQQYADFESVTDAIEKYAAENFVVLTLTDF